MSAAALYLHLAALGLWPAPMNELGHPDVLLPKQGGA